MQTIYRRKCSSDHYTPDTLFIDMLATIVETIQHEMKSPGDPLPYDVIGHCADAKDCMSCTDPANREGIINHFVTSSACAWNSNEQRCTTEFAQGLRRSNVIYDWEYCPTEEHAESFIQQNETGLRKEGRPKALLVGFRYTGTKNELSGTVPDVVRVFNHLHLFQNYNARDITIFTDDPSQLEQAKKAGAVIYDASCPGCGTWSKLSSIIQIVRRKIQPGDHFFWAYSGHGSFIDDQQGDELDGVDETIITPSVEHYRDDDFYEFISRLPAVTISAVSDACYNEGFSDLPFNFMSEDGQFCTDWRRLKRRLPTAKIMFLSGSQNYQTSTDLGTGGALTLYAIGDNGLKGHWGVTAKDNVSTSLQKVHQNFQKRGISQIPNVCSFPTFRETSQYTPFDVLWMDNMHWDKFVGGKLPSYSHFMRVPAFCKHGHIDHKNRNHIRYKEPLREGLIMIDERLNSASRSSRDLPVQGWFEVTTTTTTTTSTTTTTKRTPTRPNQLQPGLENPSVAAHNYGGTGAYEPYNYGYNPGVDQLMIFPNTCTKKVYTSYYCAGFSASFLDGTVQLVSYGGPAWRAGLQKGDVVKHVRVVGDERMYPWKTTRLDLMDSMMTKAFYVYVTRSVR
eukprot:TRINITY_DN17089_c0_g1_i1.p1 TRINITY_DN17089_c0_g1~~TRINITY_DN17089_c0_g1_i1.p1  ORF type:complete len:621 (+),score=53.63 TRINITY_DN17089_c0_g1_i1:402-2264(+)